jgi:hypothetical protein
MVKAVADNTAENYEKTARTGGTKKDLIHAALKEINAQYGEVLKKLGQ